MKRIINAVHPDDDAHYSKMGLKRGVVEVWEDGLRTSGGPGTYEWWYNDAHFPDGSVLVMIFYTKLPVDVSGNMRPQVTLELTLPDGRKITDEVFAAVEDSHYSTEGCDVKIGSSWIKGDLNRYEMEFHGSQIDARVTLEGNVPAWRSQTGSILFGNNEEEYFAWLPAVPEGKAVADVSLDGKELHLEGSGYHDHNWGNAIMLKLMHHWYWGRAKIGDYNVISAWITAEKKYGYRDFDVFMLAKDGRIIGDNSNHTLKFLPTDEYVDGFTGKPVYNKVVYEYETESGEQYRITYDRRSDIAANNFIDLLSGIKKLGARLIGFSGSYLRVEGIATVERIEDGRAVESVSEPAVWELMYFGKSGADRQTERIYGSSDKSE